jgi:hypothetical protein
MSLAIVTTHRITSANARYIRSERAHCVFDVPDEPIGLPQISPIAGKGKTVDSPQGAFSNRAIDFPQAIAQLD